MKNTVVFQFLKEYRNHQLYQRLLLDNLNRPLDKYATIDESGITRYEFDEVHLTKQAAVHVAPNNVDITVDIRRLYGDRSGLIHIHDRQTFIIQYQQSDRTPLVSQTNLKTDAGSTIILPASTHVYGNGAKLRDATEKRALDLNGTLTGWFYLLCNE